MPKISFLILSLLLVFAVAGTGSALAATEDSLQTHPLMTPQEQEIYQKSKKRLYRGGKDEESLKVQSQLPSITRKMAPVQDAPTEEPEEHQESSTD